MHGNDTLKEILQAVQDGSMDLDKAMDRFRYLPFEDLGHTVVDSHRALRNGFPEVIYGEGKTAEQVGDIFESMGQTGNVLATRVPEATAAHVAGRIPDVTYEPLARTLTLVRKEITYLPGEVGIITAGTSDLPVAEEARVSCDMLGCRSFVMSDVGVAGIHRLFDRMERIRSASVLIVIAGMEGALASVVGGLVEQPVIAVPTSVGYGASFQGVAALLGMLTSCASGISVVNIDNGFGAACAAFRICSAIQKEG
ncbi:MAG: 1-(5-phosphoribosyl)-5-amino-4-imidazole-carboxylate carboxylase [Desulfovibrio sp.]|nr:1-(5-phosphoribosyl)-5-amino-4-imidazole-carboxylate carboxylase [Desulfovibrio sp.]|tara:strand:- start:941 stop:1702 length:762 start_codon:yes stop_codon:yes gene_type:complete